MAGESALSPEQQDALRALDEFWRAGYRSDRSWTREELHDRHPFDGGNLSPAAQALRGR